MSLIRAIGIDVGPTPGLVGLTYRDGRLIKTDVIQCSAGLVVQSLRVLVAPYGSAEVYVGVERFVIGTGSHRTGPAGARTRDMVGEVQQACVSLGVTVVDRPAVEVKRWADDTKLKAAGLLLPTKGMTHARDGARHALFTACHDGNIPNPLSRKARRTDG
jgi:hypothetical protein